MSSLLLKSNMISLIYLLFVIRYSFTKPENKGRIIVKINTYVSIMLFFQYLAYVINLTSKTSPKPFPKEFETYPKNKDDSNLNIKYDIPLFFHYKFFKDLKFCYLLGIGVDREQLRTLVNDFVCLYCASMYIMHHRNPLLAKSMKKVFWQFPSPSQDIRKFKRIDDKVKK